MLEWTGLTSKKEERTQLHFLDDGSFEFRKLPFQDACLIEKKDDKIDRAWKHFYASELRFDGYGKKFPADMVILGFNRDFILDPFNKIPVHENPAGGKPKKIEADIRSWTAQVAESQRYKVMNKPGNMLLMDKITLFLGLALILEIFIIGISMAWGGK